MSILLQECYPPSEMIVDVERLAISDPGERSPEDAAEFSAVDWEQVNQVIRRIFARLATHIRQRRPEIVSHPGHTSGGSFPLFSHRTFEVPTDQAINPVVVGIDFDLTADRSKVVIRGDITAEETGEVFYEMDRSCVLNTRTAVLAAAHQIGNELARQEDVILENLVQPSFPQA